MKIIISIILLCISNSYSEEQRYTKAGIPIKFIGLYDVSYDTDNLDTNSIIYKIKEQTKSNWRK